MINLKINGLQVAVQKGSTLLEAARFLGFPIPTLCHMEGLSPYGACRLCVVEIGEGPGARLVSSCTYPAQEGLSIRTASERVLRARRMVLELLLASCPQSRTIQDLAAAHGVRQQRFHQEHEDCILCGLCVRMCKEQMVAGAIGFRGRGDLRSIGTPFDVKSEVCRLCGGCIYVCPACQLRCTFNEPDKAICGGCANLAPPCIEKERFHDMMCYMTPCVACEIQK
ncbi:MAG: 2Fe-2S iron-sulfur cluster-binding protein [Candidatus Krumholzibacteriia bacterium]